MAAAGTPRSTSSTGLREQVICDGNFTLLTVYSPRLEATAPAACEPIPPAEHGALRNRQPWLLPPPRTWPTGRMAAAGPRHGEFVGPEISRMPRDERENASHRRTRDLVFRDGPPWRPTPRGQAGKARVLRQTSMRTRVGVCWGAGGGDTVKVLDAAGKRFWSAVQLEPARSESASGTTLSTRSCVPSPWRAQRAVYRRWDQLEHGSTMTTTMLAYLAGEFA